MVTRIWAGQASGVQARHDWLSGPRVGPGWSDAKGVPGPGSREKGKSGVSREGLRACKFAGTRRSKLLACMCCQRCMQPMGFFMWPGWNEPSNQTRWRCMLRAWLTVAWFRGVSLAQLRNKPIRPLKARIQKCVQNMVLQSFSKYGVT